MTIDEKVVYRESPDSKEWTVSERQAWVGSNMRGLSRAVQAFGMDRFKKNVIKAYRGFNIVLDAMYGQKEVADLSAYSHFHPWLMRTITERAKNLTEAAKSKAKSSPLNAVVAAQIQTTRQ